jgi:hypothetical protein
MTKTNLQIIFLILFALAASYGASAQTFGKPEEEQVKMSSISNDIEKLSQLTEKLKNIRKQKTLVLGDIDKKPRAVLEKWKLENEALTSYISMFQDLHGASAVLMNAIGLSLYVKERNLPPYYLTSICLWMPGEGRMITVLKEKYPEDQSVVRYYTFIGEGVLEQNELTITLEGLQVSDRLAHSYNLLCNRVRKSENWNR